MLQQAVLLDVLEDEGAPDHVEGDQHDHAHLGEHEGQEDLDNTQRSATGALIR